MSGAHLVRANAVVLPLADESVDLIVTSPPYFALRSYHDGGEHYDGQLGAEATPAEFVDALIAATREMVRVLKPSGSIFVNLGDKYARNGGGGLGSSDGVLGHGSRPASKATTVRPKSLIGIPWRYALRCIDDLDLILRAEIIWAKPNGLPESVTDRVARKHEQWFHFTKSERYFSAIDMIREQTKPENLRYFTTQGQHNTASTLERRATNPNGNKNSGRGIACNPLGKLPGSVWTVATEPLRVPDELGVDHFAAFPTEFPRRIITGWSPEGICTACGEGRRPTTKAERARDVAWRETQGAKRDGTNGLGGSTLGVFAVERERAITGEACSCPDTTAPTRPAVVLDPFGGTGTTASVAKALGRVGISVDLSADYLRLADWRCNGTGHDVIRKKLGQQIVTVNADQMSLDIA